MAARNGIVDQGLRYELAALIATADELAPLVAGRPQARLVPLHQDLALVPVTRALLGALDGAGEPLPPETGFRIWSPGVLALLVEGSGAGPVAYVEADYHGRDGRQTAAVWLHGHAVYGPEILGHSEPFPDTGGGPIGEALRRLGACAVGRRDEFVAVGLGRCRRTEDWR